MLGISVNDFVSLGEAMLSGKNNAVSNLIENKLQSLGQKMVTDMVGQVVTAPSFAQIPIISDFQRGRDQWLNAILRPLQQLPGPLGTFANAAGLGSYSQVPMGQRGAHAGPAWQRTDWAASRQDWLDNKWKHDWRSQPRDILGRWMPGRLDYIPSALQYTHSRAGRVLRKRRQQQRARRAAYRPLARQFIASWGRDGN
jgi:hypothetical protein